MPDQLVCTRCWKWYDGRTVCPNCKVPLIHPGTGHPVADPAAAAGDPASPGSAQSGADPYAASPEADYAPPVPEVSGYPTGTPLDAPTRTEMRHILADDRAAALAPSGPLHARMAPPPPADLAPPGPGLTDQAAPAAGAVVTDPSALGLPTWGTRERVGYRGGVTHPVPAASPPVAGEPATEGSAPGTPA